MKIARRAIVRGHVQGVFFRASTRQRAVARGVAGWAANRPDGAVEVFVEGEPEAVDAVLGWLHEGPRGALVERVEVAEAQPEGLSGFEAR